MNASRIATVHCESAMPFRYPKMQKILYWFAKAAGFSKRHWAGDNASAHTVQRIIEEQWLPRERQREFLADLVAGLVPDAAAMIEELPIDELYSFAFSMLDRWDAMADRLNSDSTMEFAAPLGAVPVLRLAAIAAGFVTGAAHALRTPDGSASIDDPLAGGMFAGYLRRILEQLWPGQSTSQWAIELSGVVDRKTVYKWLNGKLPSQFDRVRGVLMHCAEEATQRQGITAKPHELESFMASNEWRPRTLIMLDRLGEWLRNWFGEEYCDYYHDLANELVRTAKRSYAVLTHPEYTKRELHALATMLDEAGNLPGGSVDDISGLVHVLGQLGLMTDAGSKPQDATELASFLKTQIHEIERDEERRARWRLLLCMLTMVPRLQLPHFKVQMMMSSRNVGWIHDFLALSADLYPRLELMHSMHRQWLVGVGHLDGTLVQRGIWMFEPPINRSVIVQSLLHHYRSEAPPGTPLHDIVAMMNEGMRAGARQFEHHTALLLGKILPNEWFQHIRDMDHASTPLDELQNLAFICLYHDRLEVAHHLAFTLLDRAPERADSWQLAAETTTLTCISSLPTFLLVARYHSDGRQRMTAEQVSFVTGLADRGQAIIESFERVLVAWTWLMEETARRIEAENGPSFVLQHERMLRYAWVKTHHGLSAAGATMSDEEMRELAEEAAAVIELIQTCTEGQELSGRDHEQLAFMHMIAGERKTAQQHAREAARLGWPDALKALPPR